MNLMLQVLELSKHANIPDSIVAHKMLGVSRATIATWKRNGIPESRTIQLQALKNTLQNYIDSGVLPIAREDMLWQGLMHITECSQDNT